MSNGVFLVNSANACNRTRSYDITMHIYEYFPFISLSSAEVQA